MQPRFTMRSDRPRNLFSAAAISLVWVTGVAYLLSLPLAAPAAASYQTGLDSKDPERAYIEALRERKLYRLLEVYCRQQLERPDVTPADSARYTIELANILASRAQSEPRTAVRVELWEQACQVLRAFLQQNAAHPQATALQFQIGVYELAQGELGRQQAKLVPQDSEVNRSARAHLNAAILAFRQVEAEATQLARNRPSGENAAGGQSSANSLRALASNAKFRLAQALLAVAQTYPRHSADQTETAAQAKSLFETFTQRYSNNELTLESFLGRAECQRILGDPAEALKSLGELNKAGTPDKYTDRALVLRAQLQIDQKNLSAARNFIDDSRKLLKTPNPELDLLYVQSLLELARQQSRGQADLVARQLVASALEEIDQIDKQHGAYWAGRAELLLAELAAENVLVEEPAVLVRMADGQFRRGDRLGAVKTLDRAVKLSRERGDTDRLVELSFRAASMLVQEKQFDAAARRFAEIANSVPNHATAPQAQFMVAYCLGQHYAANPSAEVLTSYERALEQHLKGFGADETAHETRWLLGSLRVNQRRWRDGIELLKAIAPSHRQYSPARDQIRRAYELWLQDLWQRSQPSETVASEAIDYLKQSLADRRGKQWGPTEIPAALSLARIDLNATVGRFQEAEDILNQILFGQAANDTERGEARRLIVAALLGQDKFDEARRMIETEFVGVPQELFAVAQSLESASARGPEARRRQIGRLQLIVTERLVRDAEQLTGEQAVQAEIYLALAYVNSGQAARADELFAKLNDRVANDPRVLEAQAECFMQLGRYNQARDLWRQLLGQLRESSPGWYEAKYNLALACYNSGDGAQALKIILVTEQLHPDMGGAEMKTKFSELKAKCRAR